MEPGGNTPGPIVAAPFVMVSAADHLGVSRHEGVIEATRPLALAVTVRLRSLHLEPVTVTECIAQAVA